MADWLLLSLPVSWYLYLSTRLLITLPPRREEAFTKREREVETVNFFTTILLGDLKTTDTKHLKTTTFAIKYVASNVIQWNEDNIFFEHYNPLIIMEKWWLLWCSNTSCRQQFLRICSSLFSDDLLNRFSAFFKAYVWATTTREQMSSSAAQQNI